MTKNGKGISEAHGGNLRAAREKYPFIAGDFLDFSANINPLGLSDSVRQTLLAQLENVVNYPDAEAKGLKQALAARYDIAEEQLAVGNGAVELIYVLAHCLRPRTVLIPSPAFSEYERAVRSVQANVRYFPLLPEYDFTLDVPGLIQALPSVERLFLCNPHNPVGNVAGRKDLHKIIRAAARQHTITVIDESFLDFLPNAADVTCRYLVKEYQNLIIVHSLTKFFAIPGLRLGFGVMSPELVSVVERAKDVWNVNSLAQAAGAAALKDNQYIKNTVEFIAREKQIMFEALRRINGIRVYEPAVNFIFARLENSGYNAKGLADATARQGILIRDCGSYPGLDDRYLRIAVKRRADNLRLLALFERLLGVRNAE